MSKVFQALQPWLTRMNQAEQVWVAFSGGLDSTVLLHLVATLRLLRVTALHVNHQLSPSADFWEQQSAGVAKAMGCEFESVRVNVKGRGGLERSAREARYQVFKQKVRPGDVLLMAHHANDQAETVLYRLMRGAGLRGLSGIPRRRPLGEDTTAEIIRPLLEIPREALKSYAVKNNLRWVDDESNADSRFDRNYIRHDVVPALSSRWPHGLTQIARSARLLAESELLLNQYINVDFASLEERSERVGYSLCIRALSCHPWLKQRHLLRYWFNQHQVLAPSEAQLDEIRSLLSAAADANPIVSWGDEFCADQIHSPQGGQIYRYRNRLYLLPKLPAVVFQPRTWQPRECCELSGFTLSASRTDIGLPNDNYLIGYRQGGERCRPAGRAHSQTLKKLLQASALEPWLRDRVPLIYRDQTLVAVGDLWLCEGVAVPGGWQPEWRYNSHF